METAAATAARSRVTCPKAEPAPIGLLRILFCLQNGTLIRPVDNRY
jgi:hypothetical protein